MALENMNVSSDVRSPVLPILMIRISESRIQNGVICQLSRKINCRLFTSNLLPNLGEDFSVSRYTMNRRPKLMNVELADVGIADCLQCPDHTIPVLLRFLNP